MRLIESNAPYAQPWYGSYHSMMDRCYRSKSVNFKFYGGRGIKVCDEWHDAKVFGRWAENSGFKSGLTLDRIDPNRDYSPDNCRWVTAYVQANNRRNTLHLTAKGETHTVSEWARITGINRSTINNRICRGWTHERALTKGDMRRVSVD